MQITQSVFGDKQSQLTYQELNERLKFPTNPAYFKQSKNEIINNKTLLDFCREQNIPFNETDKLLYKLQQSKETFEIYRVLFDQLTNNNKPFVAAANMVSSVHTGPIKLPNGNLHIGWPSRQETAQEEVQRYKKQMEPLLNKGINSKQPVGKQEESRPPKINFRKVN